MTNEDDLDDVKMLLARVIDDWHGPAESRVHLETAIAHVALAEGLWMVDSGREVSR
jgi:hypothetical protein